MDHLFVIRIIRDLYYPLDLPYQIFHLVDLRANGGLCHFIITPMISDSLIILNKNSNNNNG